MKEDDLNRMDRLIHERLAVGSNPGLVPDLSWFEGYETPSAMLEDFRIDKAHSNDFRRVAVIEERRWMEWGTKLVDLFTRAEMRWFDAGELDAAVAWTDER